MMQKHWIEKKLTYEGSQLKPLFAYLNYHLMGHSIVSWQGPCQISLEHMVDGEDFIENAKICGDEMLHFIIEVFDQKLMTGVALQRLFASIVKDYLAEKFPHITLVREGDDLYWNEKKLSISIASISQVSTMIHFAMNIVNEGTPVPTCALEDFWTDSSKSPSVPAIARDLMLLFVKEFESIYKATCKVKPL
jgi:hypothetical protein